MRHALAFLSVILLAGAWPAQAASPTCVAPEVKLTWPAVNPVWEMCWLGPAASVGPRGSGMELRNVHFNGRLVMRRAHAPMLFAEYKDGNGGNCYRDWKDDTSPVLADEAVQNHLGLSVDPPTATTACDRSQDPTASYGTCPFQLPGYSNSTPKCNAGFAIEDNGDHVVLTTQYRADWYMYASRWTFWNDGRIEPSFGFGNRNGTYNTVTHWHHYYWRMEFGIDGGHNTISRNGVDAAAEFTDLRSLTGGPGGGPKTWEVRNPTTGNGYKLIPGADDYDVVTNESGRNFHVIDVMGTRQHDLEYGDSPNYSLSDCTMDEEVLVNGESIADTNIALYYRVAVRDATANSWPPGCSGASCIPQDSMVCKKVGPTLMAFGPWVQTTPTQPAATVAPGNIDVTVFHGASTTDMFGLTNSGDPGSTLTYTIDTAPISCANPAAVTWLGRSPDQGSVAAGATTTITASVDATSLPIGNHTAFICVHTNDPLNALVSVPVNVTVELDPSDVIFINAFELP